MRSTRFEVRINAYIKDLLIKHIPNNTIFYYLYNTHHRLQFIYIYISILPLLPLILCIILYLILPRLHHNGEYNIIVRIVYSAATERRLMDAPRPIVKDRLRGRKHYYYYQPPHLCSRSGKGRENDSLNDVLQNNYYYFIYYIIAETACLPFVGVV